MTEPCYGNAEYKSVDIQSATLFLDIASSLFEPADHRGGDDILAGLPGRYRRNRVPDQRLITLVGWTRGVGVDVEERQQSWADAEATLGGLLDPDDDGDLVAMAPYLGLSAGTASITCYPLSWTPGIPQSKMTFRLWTVVLEAVGNPPDWTVAESSS